MEHCETKNSVHLLGTMFSLTVWNLHANEAIRLGAQVCLNSRNPLKPSNVGPVSPRWGTQNSPQGLSRFVGAIYGSYATPTPKGPMRAPLAISQLLVFRTHPGLGKTP